jgi:1-acyl-sn-glycerol-3-phosphate acyltransferase
MLKIIGKLILQLSGWKIVDKTPLGIKKYPKAVIIAVPHTSNWDYPYAMATLYAMGCKIRYLAKDSLFKFPLGVIIRGLGGIPVNRSQKNNLVQMMTDLLINAPEMQLLVPAEGTRSFTSEWKSGFYHIAQNAGVPIVLGFLDFGKKEAGFLGVFQPSGNYEEDLPKIQSFYKNITPKHPEYFSLKDAKFD